MLWRVSVEHLCGVVHVCRQYHKHLMDAHLETPWSSTTNYMVLVIFMVGMSTSQCRGAGFDGWQDGCYVYLTFLMILLYLIGLCGVSIPNVIGVQRTFTLHMYPICAISYIYKCRSIHYQHTTVNSLRLIRQDEWTFAGGPSARFLISGHHSFNNAVLESSASDWKWASMQRGVWYKL